jgi:hypothetical protein
MAKLPTDRFIDFESHKDLNGIKTRHTIRTSDSLKNSKRLKAIEAARNQRLFVTETPQQLF